MATATVSPQQAAKLVAQTRQRLVAQATVALDSVLSPVHDRLLALANEAAPLTEMQLRRDASMAFHRCRMVWRDGVVQAWQKALLPASTSSASAGGLTLELLGTEVVENRIAASRLAMSLMDKAAQDITDLRKRLKFLNRDQELAADDIVHPEALLLPLVEQWEASGLSREAWPLVRAVVQLHFNEQLQKAYAQCNADLIAQGVLPVIELQPRVSAAAALPERPASRQSAVDAADTGVPMNSRAMPQAGAGLNIGRPTIGHAQRSGRVQGILEQLGRLFSGVAPGGPAAGAQQAPSAPLMTALAQQPRLNEAYFSPGMPLQTGAPVIIAQVASDLRAQSTDLKRKAGTDNEKAIIELVALMFQSILQEDRLPSGVRVWFARLQMPVLRVALAEPDFFQKLDHPARLLIDHMGSCVMGFDSSGISSAELETEIKRVVQVIEQYPETGDKVYRRVYEEFQAFLKQHLAKKPSSQVVLGVAEQLEQKETLTIQYTIEMRDQLKDMPVRDEIREFLFKVWAEVLAISAVRQGGQHEDTLLLKKTATDLIWAASAKPNRADRAKVIAGLPTLLQSLRTGMSLLGAKRTVQDAHLKVISDTLADAFMSKTQSVADTQIQALAQRLAELDDYVSEDGGEELPLDSQNIEELLGIEAIELDVINEGGEPASPDMLTWARKLALGSWFTLSYGSQVAQVQLVWRSPLGHLHLFANNVGHSYLFQSARLAGYLQAGLLLSQEDEPLLTRAARLAMDEIQVNPARVLH
ncbi:DUF1631 family protein [Rhodoferax sp.]|uniref:DUF1631 family protein n=1 Tax=Rhodoferax sp. TaxID=50421 RepID=UPI00261ED687|nr:DUF1631 family protein [Rhodoferax sp.]MDD2926038.1 DUF1631 family protein [Rhodoferax sp.]